MRSLWFLLIIVPKVNTTIRIMRKFSTISLHKILKLLAHLQLNGVVDAKVPHLQSTGVLVQSLQRDS